MLLIPAIDLRAGRCVRLYQGNFQAETRYDHDPLELLERYRALGASWLHLVDLDGARDGTPANRAVIGTLLGQSGIRVQVGGGIRSLERIEDLLEAGAARVVIGSTAVEQPQIVRGWLERFGAERICLALDIRHDAQGVPQVRTRGWREAGALSLWQVLERYPAGSIAHVLCTDIERDGALAGPNLELYRAARERFPGLAWQASGGVRDANDLHALSRLGVAAAVSGKALLEERMAAEELRPFLPAASFPA
jgi:phosphoribosylformimino-5-aminoimidazole carboxamide ribotide isomerase